MLSMLKQLIICFFLASFLNAGEINSHEGTTLVDTGWVVQNSGTQVRLYAVKAVDGSVAWVGGAGGVVRRTTNGGQVWINGGTVFNDVYTMTAIDSVTALVATSSPSSVRILRTTDAGSTWQQVYLNTDPVAFIDAV